MHRKYIFEMYRPGSYRREAHRSHCANDPAIIEMQNNIRDFRLTTWTVFANSFSNSVDDNFFFTYNLCREFLNDLYSM